MGNLNPKPIHPDLRDWLVSKKIKKSQQEQIRQQFDILCNILNESTIEIAGKKIKIQITDLPNQEEDAKFWDEIEKFPG
jgi:uncharacterized protein (UPF0371 family)